MRPPLSSRQSQRVGGRARAAWEISSAGVDSFDRRAWAAAHERLSSADRQTPLGADDLERLALAAYLIGRDDEYLTLLQRAHQAHLKSNRPTSAARAAFWVGLRLLFRGEQGQAQGWLARARRLVDAAPEECVERGYLLLAASQLQLEASDWVRADESAQARSAPSAPPRASRHTGRSGASALTTS